MKYEIGDVVEVGGTTRKVTGASLVGGEIYPTTEPCDEPVTVKAPVDKEVKLREELEAEIRAELEAKIRAEILEEQQGAPEDEGKEPNLSRNLICQYCGRECGSPIGLNSHEKACEMNPDNKGGEEK